MRQPQRQPSDPRDAWQAGMLTGGWELSFEDMIEDLMKPPLRDEEDERRDDN